MTDDSFEIEELGGDRYPSLEEAHTAALPHLAELLASIVRQGIENGTLLVVNGMVRLAERCESEGIADQSWTNGEDVV